MKEKMENGMEKGIKVIIRNWYGYEATRTDIILMCLYVGKGRNVMIAEKDTRVPGFLCNLGTGSSKLWSDTGTTELVVRGGTVRVSEPGVITIFAKGGGIIALDEDYDPAILAALLGAFEESEEDV